MPDIWMDVDAAVTVPVNIFPLIDDTDFKTREVSVTYNQSGLDLVWNFVTTAGVQTHVAVTPTDTAGAYDWVNVGHGMYNIEIPASGGASANNDTEGFGWFVGYATGVLPWRGPVIGFRAAAINNGLVDGATLDVNVATCAATPAATIADALLDRNMATGADNGSETVRTPRQALRFLRNKWSIDGSKVLTVTKENDTTASWTSQLSTSAVAEPVTASDPTST